MNKMMKGIFFAILTLAMLLSFTGCGDSEDIQSSDPVNIAFVVGIADDETKLNEGIPQSVPRRTILQRRSAAE